MKSLLGVFYYDTSNSCVVQSKLAKQVCVLDPIVSNVYLIYHNFKFLFGCVCLYC